MKLVTSFVTATALSISLNAFASKVEAQIEMLLNQQAKVQQQIDSLYDKDDLTDAEYTLLDQLELDSEALNDKLNNLEQQQDMENRGPAQRAFHEYAIQLGPDITPEQQKKLDMLAEKAKSEMRQQMQGNLNLLSQSAQGTEDQITLPVYPNSKIMVHLTQGGTFDYEGDGVTVNTLPSATFATADSPEEVLAFYQRKLSNYQFKQSTDDTVLLMESMSPGFDLLKDMEQYVSTQHIAISKIDGSIVGAPGANTRIEIAYKK
ncbi:hypothetical protein P2G88_12140 [Aliiglaciecola sp. CAU 1673]|uniref:hypothetical protein n=1 Tax=Aliiglaciecola sp. CAU 1673 TaxID=3032595 RepID=UPI0023DAD48E|nr:hypothetical protein [Aliiglaciecola sp. CAU 1673]MDF2179001.1 hypothetical protein [Aliiglaciecola sp. CAU 1673]